MLNDMDIRDKIITGSCAIGVDGRKEPLDWEEYALKLESELNNQSEEKARLHMLVREVSFRLNLALPTSDQEEEWFNERLNTRDDFQQRLFRELFDSDNANKAARI